MNGAYVRILARYGTGALVVWGVMTPGMAEMVANDPDVQLALNVGLGIVISGLVEGYYMLAKRWGLPT